MMRGPALLAVAAVLTGAASSATPRSEATIVIDKMAFGPAPKGLHVGQTVVWENRDMFQHSATDKAGGFDVTLKPHAQARTRLTRQGKVPVFCRFHPGMTLTLDVAKE